jgi:hypothetical protein
MMIDLIVNQFQVNAVALVVPTLLLVGLLVLVVAAILEE